MKNFGPFYGVPDSMDGRKRFRYAWTTRIFFDKGKYIWLSKVIEELVWFWFYYPLWLASVFTLVLVLRQSSENRSNSKKQNTCINRRLNSSVVCLFARLLFAETKGIVTERHILCLLLRIFETILTEATNIN